MAARAVDTSFFAMVVSASQAAIAVAMVIFAARHAVSCAKRRFLVIHAGGRREWVSDGSEDEEVPKYFSWEPACLEVVRPQNSRRCGLHATVARDNESRVECRVAACAVVRRSVCAYISMLKRGIVTSGGQWWAYDDKLQIQIIPDPDGVLVAIATLARCHASRRAALMALADTTVSDEVAAASVGVGHKMASSLECLHLSRGFTLGASIARELGVCVDRDPQAKQMLLETNLVSEGCAFSCTTFNLASTFDARGGSSGRCYVDDLLLRGVSRVLNVALMLDHEFRLDLVTDTHGSTVVEAAFCLAVHESTHPFVAADPPPDQPAPSERAIRDVAFLMVHAGLRSWATAYDIMTPPGHADVHGAVLNVFATGDAFRKAVMRLS